MALIFMDSTTAKGCFYKGNSPNKHLWSLILRLQTLEMSGEMQIHGLTFPFLPSPPWQLKQTPRVLELGGGECGVCGTFRDKMSGCFLPTLPAGAKHGPSVAKCGVRAVIPPTHRTSSSTSSQLMSLDLSGNLRWRRIIFGVPDPATTS
jgi:hypothetical protein